MAAVVAVVAVVVGAAFLFLYFFTVACAASPGDAAPVNGVVSLQVSSVSVSPSESTHFENVSFRVASAYSSCIPPRPFTTAWFDLELWSVNGTGRPLLGPAVCAPPQNFSSCSSETGAWYAVLFAPSSAPGIQASFESHWNESPPTWTATVEPTALHEELSIVSAVALSGHGYMLSVLGVHGYDVTGEPIDL
ncbi:MAG: hypothetical protein KGJ23_16530 [Euryarchaeota archaeon]|nr:hypothetical protein [Euryarchaeota archaeon]MDE1838204.1 hypothetical protein [Euryarchaeota archaeon]MDE2046704.1 hypothetical protein [Thermoplasmata archaeon]